MTCPACLPITTKWSTQRVCIEATQTDEFAQQIVAITYYLEHGFILAEVNNVNGRFIGSSLFFSTKNERLWIIMVAKSPSYYLITTVDGSHRSVLKRELRQTASFSIFLIPWCYPGTYYIHLILIEDSSTDGCYLKSASRSLNVQWFPIVNVLQPTGDRGSLL